ncbi:MAG: VIT1/CCC1 transporter family protein, partial [Candidatus Bipolaricaulota bacterium]
MNAQKLDPETRKKILTAQRNEITEYHIYHKLASFMDDTDNGKVLRQIGDDELEHYNFWKEHTGTEVQPNRLKIWFYFLISIILGVTFGIKLMEQGEESAQETYSSISRSLPQAKEIVEEEDEHEEQLIELIDEERLNYVGSIILGLNDALVELTGALAGFTLAMQNTRLIAMAGLITGISASLSMAASEYLSTKSEGGKQNPLKASIYTGMAYILTVLLLILPYLFFTRYYLPLGVTLAIAVFVIFVFNLYVAVAQG